MNGTKLFLFAAAIIAASTTLAAQTTTNAFAQVTPPALEDASKPATTETAEEGTSLGKVTIQISQTEQIVLDLPLKSDNTYQVVPIK